MPNQVSANVPILHPAVVSRFRISKMANPKSMGWGQPGVCWPIRPVGCWVRQDDGDWELKVRTVIEVE